MLTTHSKEQLWNKYKDLPEQIKEILFAEETFDSIKNICEKNDISEKDSSLVSSIVNQILFGMLPIDEFQDILTEELKIKKEIAVKIAKEINRFLFYPIKDLLNNLNKVPDIEKKENIKTKKTTLEEPKEEKTVNSGPDSYREEIE